MRVRLSTIVASFLTLLLAVYSLPRAEETTHEHDHASPAHAEKEAPGHSHERAMLHQGQVSMTKQHHFESLFAPDGIRVYLYDQNQVPMQVGKATGTVTVKSKDGSSHELKLQRTEPKEGEHTAYFCPSHPDETQMEPGICKQCGTMKLMMQDYLFAPIDLSKVVPESTKATVHVKGLAGDEPEATFTETIALILDGAPSEQKPHDEGDHSGHSH